MGDIIISPDGLDDAFYGIIEAFREECDADAKRAVQAGGKACRDALRSGPLVKTGEYNSGWSMRTEGGGYDGYYVRMYNANKPSLTHLLELGHAKVVFGNRTGGRVQGFGLIAEAKEIGQQAMLGEFMK